MDTTGNINKAMKHGEKNSRRHHRHNLNKSQIIESILLRVSSIKDLVRFRSVSKSWKTLIDSDHFKKTHFEESTTKSRASTPNILIWRDIIIHDEPTLHMMYPHADDKICEIPFNLGEFLEPSERMFLSLGEGSSIFQWFGAAHGLAYLCLNSNHVIFNPCTKQYKSFHGPPTGWALYSFTKFGIPPTTLDEFFYGFGFDPLSKDYKCLMAVIAPYSTTRAIVLYQLFSLKKHSWKGGFKILPFISHLVDGDGCMDDGKFYWFAKCFRNDNNILRSALIMFDFSIEDFHYIPLLGVEFAAIHEAVVVANCGYLEMLMTFIHREDEDECEDEDEDEDEDGDFLRCEVWRVQNDGTFRRKVVTIFPKKIGTPIGLSKEDNLMFQGSLFQGDFNDFLLINPYNHSCHMIEFDTVKVRVFNFVESLFSVNP